MKYFFLLLLFIGFGYFILTRNFTERPKEIAPIPTPAISSGTKILLGDKIFLIHYEHIDSSKLELISNFSQKYSSQQIMSEHNCQRGINGGFYTPDNFPLGLFFTYEGWINKIPHRSNLLNGYVYQLIDRSFDFTTVPPDLTQIRFLFQTGPWFTTESRLSISPDEPDRRMLIGKTPDQRFYFFAVTEQENSYSGPPLGQLPELFSEFSRKSEVRINELINLDGGSASAYFGSKISFEEIVSIGSLLCQK